MVNRGKNGFSIDYPSMRSILNGDLESMEGHAQALEQLTTAVFGGNHCLLTAQERRIRLDLWKLSNLIRQMGTLDDVEVFQMGFRCPEQLKRYNKCVEILIELSKHRGMEGRKVDSALLIRSGLWQICLAVTQFYEGLS